MRWKHHHEPTSAYALAPLPGGGCLAATSRGLWRYRPAHGGWSSAAPQFAELLLTSVAAHGPTWLIGSNGDIAASRNEGETWGVATLPARARISRIVLSPGFDRDGVALAATAKDGVLRSDDGGATWHAWNIGLLDLAVNALELSPAFERDETCFAATDYGLFISENGGRAWRELALSARHAPFSALTIVAQTSPASMAILSVGSENSGLWMSIEPYAKWRRVKDVPGPGVGALSPGLAVTDSGLYSVSSAASKRLSTRGDLVCVLALDDGTVVAGAANGGMWHGGP
ncbi:MAG: hypothetical protein ABIQ99_00070 [Thermoflexales bacterium]